MAKDEILLKLELEQSKVKVQIKNLKSEIADMDKRTVEYKNKVLQLEAAQIKLSNANIKVSQRNNELSASYKNLNNNLDGSTKSTGAASSAALELGRVVSDMPYGIRGVANNLSQFASNMFFMANATDKATGKTIGFTGAVKNLWASLKGPLGILIAIQAVIAAFDYFSGKVNKAEKEVDSFNDTVAKATVEFNKMEILAEVAKDTTEALDDQKQALEELKKKGYDPAKQSLDEFLDSQQKLILINAATKAAEKGLEDVIKRRLKLNVRARKEMSDLIKLRQQGFALTGAQEAIIEDIRQEYKEIEKEEEELRKGLEEAIRKGFDFSFLKDKKGLKRPRVEALDIESASDFNKRMNKIRKESLDLLKDNFDYIKPSELLKVVPEDGEIPEGVRKAIQAYNKAVVDEFLRITQLEEFQEYSELFQDVFSDINTFLQAEFDRQMTIEQNRTNALNEQLNQRLLNEQLSVDQRKAIQNQIWQNDEALRKKQEQIEKKRFRQQKAFNIAMATIDTFRAAAGVLADTKGGTFARIAGMVAVISSGLAQVAVIARQKFQSSAANTPIRAGLGGGTGGGAGDRSFNFTLAGQTEGNQLIDAIQSQFNNPIRAYVVSGDVTNQQQLEANIQSSASF